MRTLVVLPTYQEAENIQNVVRLVREHVPDAHVLVVDDGSPDGTADLADEIGAKVGQVEVLRRSGKQGLGSAYRAGFRHGLAQGFEAMVEMDSDLQHDPAALPWLLAPVADGAALTIGSRYIPGGSIPDWSWYRRMLSRWGNRYASMMLGLGVRDATSGYRVYTAEILSKIPLEEIRADGYGFQIEMAYQVEKLDGRIVEVPIAFGERQLGVSKMSSRIVVEALALVTWWSVRDRLLRRR